MTRNNLLMQMQADLLHLPIKRASCAESTAFGAAKMAGLEADLSFDRVFQPAKSQSWREAKIESWHHAIAQART
jgi:glycerol kinase